MELRQNRVKHKLRRGEQVYVASGFTHADDIDAFGPAGFDGIWIEGEHGPMVFDELGNLTRACDLWGMTSIVRVNRNDQTLIYRTLDRGAQGIVVPHVNTREEAENVVAGGRFAPIGQRGMFTSRQGYGVADYFAKANDEVLLTILIEDIVAVENLDEILTVDQIDVFFVAPSDLGASMGYIGDLENKVVQKTIDDALAKIIASGCVAGTMTSPDNVGKFSAAGVQMMLVNSTGWLQEGARTFKARAKKPRRKSSYSLSKEQREQYREQREQGEEGRFRKANP